MISSQTHLVTKPQSKKPVGAEMRDKKVWQLGKRKKINAGMQDLAGMGMVSVCVY